VTVQRDRRMIARRNKRSFRVTVRRKGLHRGNHRLTVRARDASKRTTLKSVVFRVCRTR
jgi:hypothetical protein